MRRDDRGARLLALVVAGVLLLAGVVGVSGLIDAPDAPDLITASAWRNAVLGAVGVVAAGRLAWTRIFGVALTVIYGPDLVFRFVTDADADVGALGDHTHLVAWAVVAVAGLVIACLPSLGGPRADGRAAAEH